MLYILHLELLEERYTRQWYEWFKSTLEFRRIPFKFVEGRMLTNSVETGVVLDAEGTNYWKFSQLMEICQLFKSQEINQNDIFFTMDLWHPGLESLKYMSHLEHIPIKIYGFLHAGSYTTEDFAEPMGQWARFFERGWADICNGVFVGTDYHKKKFLRMRGDLGETLKTPIHVVGNPFNTNEVRRLAVNELGNIYTCEMRENIIVFPHRWDREKRPDVFVECMNRLWKIRQDFRVVITTSRSRFRSNEKQLIEILNSCSFPYTIKANLTKSQYYGELAKSKVFVSTTVEENFGYCFVEAITLGCTPVVPNSYSHPEILRGDSRFTYSSIDQAIEKISHFLDHPVNISDTAEKFNQSINRMIDIMLTDD